MFEELVRCPSCGEDTRKGMGRAEKRWLWANQSGWKCRVKGHECGDTTDVVMLKKSQEYPSDAVSFSMSYKPLNLLLAVPRVEAIVTGYPRMEQGEIPF
jgi:hypothetical protein